MSAIASLLIPGEAVRYEAPKSKCGYIFGLVVGVLLIPLFGIGLGVLLAVWLGHKNKAYVVTTRRVIAREGAFTPKLMEIPIEKVESISVRGHEAFGAIAISGSGGSTINIPGLARPYDFRNAVYEVKGTV